MDYRVKIGLRIKHLRELKVYSIEHLANIADIDRNYLSSIEKGKKNFSIDVFIKIINALEISPLDFFKEVKI